MFYVTSEFNRFSHRRWAPFSTPVRFSKFFPTWIHGVARGNVPDRPDDSSTAGAKCDQSNWGSYITYIPNVSFELILDLTVAGATDTEEKKLSYAKKYGLLSRPGYFNRCMHSNNMCSPNSVFLSLEENQKRSVIEDKLWRLERT